MLTDNDQIDLHALPDQVVHGTGNSSWPAVPSSDTDTGRIEPEPDITLPRPQAEDGPASLLLDEVIKRTLVRSLEETDGNRRRAGDLLGISRSTLYRMLARYSLAEEETAVAHVVERQRFLTARSNR
jgi:transcriptional regulator of acetoin/glycerol metabolism